MKNAAFTIRFNNEIEADRNLLYMLKSDSKGYRSTSECIKSKLIEYYSNGDDELEEILLRTQNALMEKMYDTCLKIIGSVGGIRVSNITDMEQDEGTILPKASDEFPDELNDVLEFLAS